MRRVICAPAGLIPDELYDDVKYFCTYGNPHRNGVGYFAPSICRDLRRCGITPTLPCWDFATIAFSVIAADNAVSRSRCEDGWTRQIELDIHICNPEAWEQVKELFQNTLRFLTGDFWYLRFLPDGTPPPQPRRAREYENDCVCLLSGGMDSLIGAIDIVAQNRKPIFVSQTVQGNADSQNLFAEQIAQALPHFQWSHKLHLPGGESEDSTRSRSIAFLALAALASSAVHAGDATPVEIHMPENGLISLNIALHSGRTGSFSTKTTHPKYISGIQGIWDATGIHSRIVSRYRFKTKGEMVSECLNPTLLLELIGSSTSCGKFGRYARQHCGRCVPCMVRRAAFLHADIADSTPRGYWYQNLSTNGGLNGSNDVSAMAIACLTYLEAGIESLIKGGLSFASSAEKDDYKNMLARGFDELTSLLTQHGVI